MPTLSAFLSHSWKDKDQIVHPIAEALGRRGIIPWEDKYELKAGERIRSRVKEAIEGSGVLVLFLSEASLNSGGVSYEIGQALKLSDQRGRSDAIIPVFLGERVSLIQRHPLLAERWLSAKGDSAAYLGIDLLDSEVPGRINAVADEIAEAVYRQAAPGFADAEEVIVVLDQRGNGERTGAYAELPPNLKHLQAPTLVFRPNMGERATHQVLSPPEWEIFTRNIKWALGKALGSLRNRPDRTLHLLGYYQESLGFFLGQYINRTTRACLFVHNPGRHLPFGNEGWPRLDIPTDGTPGTALLDQTLNWEGKIPTAVLYIGREKFLGDLQKYLEQAAYKLPLIVYTFTENFERSEQVYAFIRNILTDINRLKQERWLEDIHLFSSMPVAVSALLATYLTRQHTVTIRFMERNAETRSYMPLPMPG